MDNCTSGRRSDISAETATNVQHHRMVRVGQPPTVVARHDSGITENRVDSPRRRIGRIGTQSRNPTTKRAATPQPTSDRSSREYGGRSARSRRS